MTSRYELKKNIGTGSYGSVCEAIDRDQGRSVAIKRCKHLFDDLIDCKRILRELEILSRLRHENVVQLYDIYAPDTLSTFNEVYFVMEICDTDLKKLIKQDVQLESIMINKLMYNLLVGLKYIHSAGIYHRDLKPANCLTNRDCCVKICDFGLARAVIEPPVALFDSPREVDDAAPMAVDGPVVVVPSNGRLKRHLTQHVVTRWYRAPELILLQRDYTEQIDVWSVGCIFAELLQMLPGTMIEDRGPLFPGSTCFPLSPDRKHKNDYKYHTRGGQDQLNKVFDLIGSPTLEDQATIAREDARKYLSCFERRSGIGLVNRFPHVDRLSLDLLGGMLVFNPKARITVQACLEHRLLEEVREPRSEITAPEVVLLDFDKEKEIDQPSLRKLYGITISKYGNVVPP